MGMNSSACFGYGFILNDVAKRKMEDLNYNYGGADKEAPDKEIQKLFKNIEEIFHGDNCEHHMLIIAASEVDVQGWNENPKTFNLSKLAALQLKNGKKWDEDLKAVAKVLGMKITKGKWILGCNYS